MSSTLAMQRFGGLSQRWAAMTGRERTLVSGGAVFVVLALIVGLWVVPMLRDIQRIQRDLPRLHQQKAEVERLAAAAAGRGQVSVANTDGLRQLAEGLGVKVAASGTGPFTVEFDKISFNGLTQFIAQARRNHGLTVRQAELNRQAAGVVSGRVVLAQ
jgi:type II secretory pathway component PulM